VNSIYPSSATPPQSRSHRQRKGRTGLGRAPKHHRNLWRRDKPSRNSSTAPWKRADPDRDSTLTLKLGKGTGRRCPFASDDIDAERTKHDHDPVGQGRRDRNHPVHQAKRALSWITVYIESARGELLAGMSTKPTLFLDTNEGEKPPTNPDSLTEKRGNVRLRRDYPPDSGHRANAILAICSVIRMAHTDAREHKAPDIRYIQAECWVSESKLHTTKSTPRSSIRQAASIIHESDSHLTQTTNRRRTLIPRRPESHPVATNKKDRLRADLSKSKRQNARAIRAFKLLLRQSF